MTPTPTDRAHRAIATAADRIDRERARLTSQPPAAPPDWQSRTVTLGLLLALVGGAAWVATSWVGLEDRRQRQHDRLIAVHDRDGTAHPALRRRLAEQAARLRALEAGGRKWHREILRACARGRRRRP